GRPGDRAGGGPRGAQAADRGPHGPGEADPADAVLPEHDAVGDRRRARGVSDAGLTPAHADHRAAAGAPGGRALRVDPPPSTAAAGARVPDAYDRSGAKYACAGRADPWRGRRTTRGRARARTPGSEAGPGCGAAALRGPPW